MAFAGVRPSGGGTAAPLNVARRLALIERHRRLDGARCLDAGCGPGGYVTALRGRGACSVGVEFRRNVIRAAGVAQGDLESLPFPDEAFDLVLLNEVLEHVPDDVAGLTEARRVLSENGLLAVFSPNRRHPFETHGADTKRGRAVPLFVPGVPYLPLRLGDRILRYRARNYWPRELRALVERCGFQVIDHTYVWPTFENISGHAAWLSPVRSRARSLSFALERLPFVRTLGVSQVLFATPS